MKFIATVFKISPAIVSAGLRAGFSNAGKIMAYWRWRG